MSGWIVNPVVGPDGCARVREFLASTGSRTWDVRRWDGACFYHPGLPFSSTIAALAATLERDGVIEAVILSESPGEAQAVARPGAALPEAALEWAEANLALDGRLTLVVADHHAPQFDVMRRRGYAQTEGVEMHRRMDLPAPPGPSMPRGFEVRPTAEADAPAIAALLNAAFGRDFHNAGEYLHFRRMAPSFAPELDLVATSSDGLAAYTGVCIDPENRRVIVEPVCVSPAFQQRGFAAALIRDGLSRATALGYREAIVSTGGRPGPNRLYESLGFGELIACHTWQRQV